MDESEGANGNASVPELSGYVGEKPSDDHDEDESKNANGTKLHECFGAGHGVSLGKADRVGCGSDSLHRVWDLGGGSETLFGPARIASPAAIAPSVTITPCGISASVVCRNVTAPMITPATVAAGPSQRFLSRFFISLI